MPRHNRAIGLAAAAVPWTLNRRKATPESVELISNRSMSAQETNAQLTGAADTPRTVGYEPMSQAVITSANTQIIGRERDLPNGAPPGGVHPL